MAVALTTAVLDPYKAAFGSAEGFAPYSDFWSVTDYLSTVVFFADIFLKCVRRRARGAGSGLLCAFTRSSSSGKG